MKSKSYEIYFMEIYTPAQILTLEIESFEIYFEITKHNFCF